MAQPNKRKPVGLAEWVKEYRDKPVPPIGGRAQPQRDLRTEEQKANASPTPSPTESEKMRIEQFKEKKRKEREAKKAVQEAEAEAPQRGKKKKKKAAIDDEEAEKPKKAAKKSKKQSAPATDEEAEKPATKKPKIVKKPAPAADDEAEKPAARKTKTARKKAQGHHPGVLLVTRGEFKLTAEDKELGEKYREMIRELVEKIGDDHDDVEDPERGEDKPEGDEGVFSNAVDLMTSAAAWCTVVMKDVDTVAKKEDELAEAKKREAEEAHDAELAEQQDHKAQHAEAEAGRDRAVSSVKTQADEPVSAESKRSSTTELEQQLQSEFNPTPDQQPTQPAPQASSQSEKDAQQDLLDIMEGLKAYSGTLPQDTVTAAAPAPSAAETTVTTVGNEPEGVVEPEGAVDAPALPVPGSTDVVSTHGLLDDDDEATNNLFDEATVGPIDYAQESPLTAPPETTVPPSDVSVIDGEPGGFEAVGEPHVAPVVDATTTETHLVTVYDGGDPAYGQSTAAHSRPYVPAPGTLALPAMAAPGPVQTTMEELPPGGVSAIDGATGQVPVGATHEDPVVYTPSGAAHAGPVYQYMGPNYSQSVAAHTTPYASGMKRKLTAEIEEEPARKRSKSGSPGV